MKEKGEEGLRRGDLGPHIEIEEFLGLGDGGVNDGHEILGASIVHQDLEVGQFADARGDGRFRLYVESKRFDAERFKVFHL